MVFRIPDEYRAKPDAAVFARGGTHVAVSIAGPAGRVVFSNGKPGFLWDAVDQLAILPDGSAAVQVGRRSKETGRRIVVGNWESPPFEDKLSFKIGPNGTVVHDHDQIRGGIRRLYHGDDQIGQEYDSILDYVFGPNDELVYAARKADRVVVVRGTKPIGTYEAEWLQHLQVGSDGTPAFALGVRSRQNPKAIELHLVRGTAERKIPDRAQYSPDLSTFVVSVQEKNASGKLLPTYALYHESKKVGVFSSVVSEVQFSADGKTIAYAGFAAEKGYLVRGPKKFPIRAGIRGILLRPDGNAVAYTTEEIGPNAIQQQLHVEGKPGPSGRNIRLLAWLPDGSAVACAVLEADGRSRIHVGDRGGPAYDEVKHFTCLGKTWAYAGRSDKRWQVVIEDQPGPEFDEVWPPEITGEGTQVEYGARKDREYWWQVTRIP